MIVANSIPNEPVSFCGRRLNEAMKFFCSPEMKRIILDKFAKRSSKMNFKFLFFAIFIQLKKLFQQQTFLINCGLHITMTMTICQITVLMLEKV
jgi:hypothetical protein